MPYKSDFINYAIEIGALEFFLKGRKLKSGRLSPYFFNSGKFSTGQSLNKLSVVYSNTIQDHFNPRVIFGPAYKGIPLAVSIALTFGGYMEYAFNRKETKDHGEGGFIIGTQLKGKKVVLVDDVMTTGESLAEGIKIVVEAGGIPEGCVIAVDRQERADDTSSLSAVQKFEVDYDIQVQSAITFTDIIEFLRAEGGSPMLPLLLEYKEKYGV